MKNIWMFLSFANFYQKFMKSFDKIIALIISIFKIIINKIIYNKLLKIIRNKLVKIKD